MGQAARTSSAEGKPDSYGRVSHDETSEQVFGRVLVSNSPGLGWPPASPPMGGSCMSQDDPWKDEAECANVKTGRMERSSAWALLRHPLSFKKRKQSRNGLFGRFLRQEMTAVDRFALYVAAPSSPDCKRGVCFSR